MTTLLAAVFPLLATVFPYASVAGADGAATLSAEFTARERYAVYPPGEAVRLHLKVAGHRERADTLTWTVCNFDGRDVEQGTLPVPAGDEPWEGEVQPRDHGPGYFEVHARLDGCGATLPRTGSRPAGFVSYGVLPSIEAIPLACRDDSRFGVQGTNFIDTGEFMKGDPYAPLYRILGVRWVNCPRKWFELEPERPGQYVPRLRPQDYTTPCWESANSLALLTCTEGLPTWAIDWPPGTAPNGPVTSPLCQAYPPKDFRQYADFMAKIGAEQAAMRAAQFPGLQHGHYQVHWEPDWHWKGTDEAFVKMYASAYEGLHRGDPQAVVMGPGYGVLATGVDKLEKLLPMGLGKYLDGIATHAYYIGGAKGAMQSPEDGNMVQSLRRLRRLMRTYMRPDARLFQTEWGVDYTGISYADLTPEILRRQAALVVRGHLICLGEGADVSFLFYTADYAGEDGFGLCFNLTMPDPSFGATHVSPKPVFMAAATMTRLLEGAKTIGPLDLGAGVNAYAFRRADRRLAAIWTADGRTRRVKLPIAGRSATVIDIMGAKTQMLTPAGVLSLDVDGNPHYVVW
jgi:hypothetical protein